MAGLIPFLKIHDTIALFMGVHVADTGVPVGNDVRRGVPKSSYGTERMKQAENASKIVLLLPMEII